MPRVAEYICATEKRVRKEDIVKKILCSNNGEKLFLISFGEM